MNRFFILFFCLSHQEEMRSGTHFTQQNVFLPGEGCWLSRNEGRFVRIGSIEIIIAKVDRVRFEE